MSLLGETGLRQLAAINHAKARQLATALGGVPGIEILTPRYFNEFAIRVPGKAETLVEALAAKGIIAGVPMSRLSPGSLEDVLLVCATETTTDADMAAVATALSKGF
jgi:glycine dehydrogenase subunit 1